ncbi:hypothetical protein J1614_004176 [Plenodomus biglobosus]|nr:hypothetical protein J1614_004176 [Plenodomus biglobosus]
MVLYKTRMEHFVRPSPMIDIILSANFVSSKKIKPGSSIIGFPFASRGWCEPKYPCSAAGETVSLYLMS